MGKMWGKTMSCVFHTCSEAEIIANEKFQLGQAGARTKINSFLCKAGHAAILPRQCDHVFRPQSCLLLQYYYICCGYSIKTQRPKYLSIFSGSLGSFTLSRFVVAKLKNCRVPSSDFKYINDGCLIEHF